MSKTKEQSKSTVGIIDVDATMEALEKKNKKRDLTGSIAVSLVAGVCCTVCYYIGRRSGMNESTACCEFVLDVFFKEHPEYVENWEKMGEKFGELVDKHYPIYRRIKKEK